MTGTMSEVVAGIRIPESKLAREATDLLRKHGTALLLAHSLRVFLFGAIRGRHRGLKVDHELLYFGAVFHDLGLTAKYRSRDHRFEVDSANAARDFLRANGIDESTVRAFSDGFGHKPVTTFGTMNSNVLERTVPGYHGPNFCDLIASNPLGG
jgi:hypothetical protein